MGGEISCACAGAWINCLFLTLGALIPSIEEALGQWQHFILLDRGTQGQEWQGLTFLEPRRRSPCHSTHTLCIVALVPGMATVFSSLTPEAVP